MSAITQTRTNFVMRVAQSVARRELSTGEDANVIGRQIAAFALANWEAVAAHYGEHAADDLEIVEHLTRDMLEHRERCPDTALFR